MTAVSAHPRAALARLRSSRAFVLDMDGTLVLGDTSNHGLRPIPGAVDLVAELGERKIPFLLFTNGTARTPEQYLGMLREVGFVLSEKAVMTPATSAVSFFQRQRYKRVLTLGGEGLEKPLHDAGFETVAPAGAPKVDAILVGWFREFTFGALEAACHAAWNGAKVFSCSQSLYFATARGKALGTSRAISAMIRDLTGARIHIIGKPALAALQEAARQLGVRTKELAVVGDDPSLEVPMALRGGALAVAVSTGIGCVDSFAKVPRKNRPHLIVRDVGEVLDLYRGRS
jgi:HAD superfamily hydrolase (TIGR01450 family)